MLQCCKYHHKTPAAHRIKYWRIAAAKNVSSAKKNDQLAFGCNACARKVLSSGPWQIGISLPAGPSLRFASAEWCEKPEKTATRSNISNGCWPGWKSNTTMASPPPPPPSPPPPPPPPPPAHTSSTPTPKHQFKRRRHHHQHHHHHHHYHHQAHSQDHHQIIIRSLPKQITRSSLDHPYSQTASPPSSHPTSFTQRLWPSLSSLSTAAASLITGIITIHRSSPIVVIVHPSP